MDKIGENPLTPITAVKTLILKHQFFIEEFTSVTGIKQHFRFDFTHNYTIIIFYSFRESRKWEKLDNFMHKNKEIGKCDWIDGQKRDEPIAC